MLLLTVRRPSPIITQQLANTCSLETDTFPSLIVNGQTTPQWVNVRKTNNYNSRNPVTDVTSADFRCYDSETDPTHTASTIQVPAGSTLGIMSDGTIYHPGVSMLGVV